MNDKYRRCGKGYVVKIGNAYYYEEYSGNTVTTRRFIGYTESDIKVFKAKKKGESEKEKTSHLLLRRNFSGEVFYRYHSYNDKHLAEEIAQSLKKKFYKVRIFKSPSEKFEYTVYTRPNTSTLW